MMDKAGIFSGVRGKRLAAGCIVTAVAALSVHAVMLQLLHVPYPSESFTSPLPSVVNNALAAWAAIWLYSALRDRLSGHSPLFRIGILFLLLAGINETLRGWFMNAYCLNPSIRTWAFQLMIGLPDLLAPVFTALLAAPINHYLRSAWLRAIVAALMGLLLTFVVHPLRSVLIGTIGTHLMAWAPMGEEWCQMPYGIEVLIPAYLTFVEPAIATLFCVAFAWRRLHGRRLWRLAQFTLLVLALKRQLLRSFFYAAQAKLPMMTALASMGQFTLEAAVLGFLMGLTWLYAQGGKSRL